MKAMKLCTDCIWNDGGLCKSPRNITDVSPVNGELKARWLAECSSHRLGLFTGWIGCRIHKLCGAEGRWFESKTQCEPPPVAYVAGFMFSRDLSRVALIRKQKPAWQAGLLNGIGGKVQEGEYFDTAMCREFEEETSVRTAAGDWRHFCSMTGNNDAGTGVLRVEVFAGIGLLSLLKSVEAEQIEICNTEGIHPLRVDMIEDLAWLVALAIDHLKDGRPGFVAANYP